MSIISGEIMKITDQREMQKRQKKHMQRQKGACGTEAMVKR